LEVVCQNLRLENDQLKEVSDVARNQIEIFERRKHLESLELVIKFVSLKA